MRLSVLSAGAVVSLLMVAVCPDVAIAGSVAYLYDTLGRLKSATYSNGVVIIYNYDAAGNRASVVTSGA